MFTCIFVKSCNKLKTAYILLLLQFIVSISSAQIGNFASFTESEKGILLMSENGEKIKITPYGEYIVRIQTVRKSEDFYPDDHYEMVATHDWNGKLIIDSTTSSLTLSTNNTDGINVTINKSPLRLSFSLKGKNEILLSEKDGTVWNSNVITESFISTTDEHFAGLGHEAYGRIEKLDRQGSSLKVSRGNEGACVVPFYISSKGYGIFLNTTFTHTINLCKNIIYSLEIDDEGYGGRMDYFFIAGPLLTQVIDRYTQLTGRPRFPQKSIFGLQLSDKSDPSNNGEPWWKNMINEHRKAGYAVDHQVNDNAWRASNEPTSGQMNSWFEFRTKDRYPDPAAYKKWCDENGITVTLDLNRPGISKCWGWDQSLGIPGSTSCPDFTNADTRKWIWQLFFKKALDPALKYPGDAIWLDEFDYPDHNHSTTLFSGKKWAEESINYHFNLLKSCVKEGWDPAIGESKRPYFWSRGTTAGAQRFGCYWSGDIDGNYNDMKYQIKAMQSAGISGFPYFNHDAGGHTNLTINNDNCYRQWDMAFGSFTPIWKPHGPSHNRWPLQRNSTCQSTAKKYITARYQLLPYIYTYAYIAHKTGIPMVRSMFLDDQNNSVAWQKDNQYFLGSELLVVPNCSDGNNNVSVWLPKGKWYDFWDDKVFQGDQTISYSSATGVLPVFVKEGSVIPMAPYAKSTFFIPDDTLIIHIYVGKNGTFQLYEDDGVTEKFRTKNEFRLTDINYTHDNFGVDINTSSGSFADASTQRSYQIIYHGLESAPSLFCNRNAIKSYTKTTDIPVSQNGAIWDSEKKLYNVFIASSPVNSDLRVADAPVQITCNNKNKNLKNAVLFSRDRLFIDIDYARYVNLSVSIHQLNGRKICMVPSSSTNSYQIYSWNLPELSKGLYLLKIASEGAELSHKILVH